MGLITKCVVKTLWGIPDTSQDAVLDILIAQCSARIESFVGHIIEDATLTEYYQGTGDPFLVLRNWPVNSITSVHEDLYAYSGQSADPFPATTLLTQGTDFELMKDGSGGSARSGMLRRINSVWQKPDAHAWGIISPIPAMTGGSIKVVYNAGYTTIPQDIQQACLMLMACVKRMMTIGEPLASEGWEDYSYSVAATAGEAINGLPPTTLGILSRYRNVAVG